MSTAVLPQVTRVTVPKRIGPYRICGRVGKGGMNYVMRAVHTMLQREVALKVLAPHQQKDELAYGRFKAEARAGAAVSHGNVATCFDAGRDQGWCYLAMELIEEGDLAQELDRRDGRLPERLAVALMRDTALGLEAVHQAGLLHRDIKPANILLGKGLRPKLADFGVAVPLHEQEREIVGSPGYMSPEQLQGGPVDARADVYGLAATLFHLLTGQAPFRRSAKSLSDRRAKAQRAPSLRTLQPRLSRRLDQLLQRSMAIDPAKRPASAQAFAKALDALLQAQNKIEVDVPAPAEAAVTETDIDLLAIGEAVALDQNLVQVGF